VRIIKTFFALNPVDSSVGHAVAPNDLHKGQPQDANVKRQRLALQVRGIQLDLDGYRRAVSRSATQVVCANSFDSRSLIKQIVLELKIIIERERISVLGT
jgi:hypothetical protein